MFHVFSARCCSNFELFCLLVLLFCCSSSVVFCDFILLSLLVYCFYYSYFPAIVVLQWQHVYEATECENILEGQRLYGERNEIQNPTRYIVEAKKKQKGEC